MSDELKFVLAYGTEWLSVHYDFQTAYDEAVRRDLAAALSLMEDMEGANWSPLEGDDVPERKQEVRPVPSGAAV